MLRYLILPLLAAGMLSFAVVELVRGQQRVPDPSPPVEPAWTPFAQAVCGPGLVEAQSENLAISSPLPGVVAVVAVRPCEQVAAGAELFRLDDRHLRAEVKVRLANLAAHEAQLKRLKDMPRPEELAPAEARMREARASLVDQQDQLSRARMAYHRQAVADEEVVRREQACHVSEEQEARARAEVALLRAGAWEADKAVARAAVQQARALVEQAETELERLVVRAPIAGQVLQVNVRPGEFVGTPPAQALVVLGDVSQLHVRVDLDEEDLPRFHPGAEARAMVRGDSRQTFALTFVRVEPLVVPKRSLTGTAPERVDTRVQQVIYRVEGAAEGLRVGQQVEVFIEAAAGIRGESAGP